MGDGHRVVGGGDRCQRQRERYGLAAFHEPGRGGALRIGNEIERAALIFLAPAPPVAELFEHGRDFGRRQAVSHRGFLLERNRPVYSTSRAWRTTERSVCIGESAIRARKRPSPSAGRRACPERSRRMARCAPDEGGPPKKNDCAVSE